jgi:hypothetical protein
VSRVTPKDVSKWDGNQKRTNASEVVMKNVSRNVNLVKLVQNRAKNANKRLNIAAKTAERQNILFNQCRSFENKYNRTIRKQ